MDSDILPEAFGVAVSIGLLIFLWKPVLAVTKEKLEKSDQNTAKFILFLFSLPLAGLAIHCGFDIMSSLFNLTDPL